MIAKQVAQVRQLGDTHCDQLHRKEQQKDGQEKVSKEQSSAKLEREFKNQARVLQKRLLLAYLCPGREYVQQEPHCTASVIMRISLALRSLGALIMSFAF